MNFRKTFFLLGVIILSMGTGLSQQVTELTLKSAIQNALKNNVTIIKLQNSIDAQNFNIKAKYGSLLPSLNLSGGWTRTNQVLTGNALSQYLGQAGTGTNLDIGNQSLSQTNNNYNLGLSADLTIFNGFVNYSSVTAARLTEQNLMLQLEQAKQDLILKVINDYITVLSNQQIVKINSASLEDSRAQLDMIKQFVEVGNKTLSDVYKQDAIVAQNELAVEQSKNNVDKSIEDLVFDISLPQDKTYSVSPAGFNPDLQLADLQKYVDQNSNVDQLIQNGLNNRYDYKSSLKNLDILQTNIDIARNSEIYPTISGFSSYNLSGINIGSMSNTKVFTLGINLTYPIFEGFQLDNVRQQAEVTYRSANEDVSQLERQIDVNIKKAILDLKSLVKQVEITERGIKSSEQDKLMAEESYRVGLVTLLDVQTATTTYNNALITKSNLIFNFQFSQKQLEYFQGLIKY
ncbi:MAG: TolC family protein [Ignavibacteria bacterium]|jgi:outer membrane protein